MSRLENLFEAQKRHSTERAKADTINSEIVGLIDTLVGGDDLDEEEEYAITKKLFQKIDELRETEYRVGVSECLLMDMSVLSVISPDK